MLRGMTGDEQGMFWDEQVMLWGKRRGFDGKGKLLVCTREYFRMSRRCCGG
jgi:hypothetical protein